MKAQQRVSNPRGRISSPQGLGFGARTEYSSVISTAFFPPRRRSWFAPHSAEHRAGVAARGREDFQATVADTERELETRARVRTASGARIISGVIAAEIHGQGRFEAEKNGK